MHLTEVSVRMSLRNSFAVSRDLSCSTATPITLRLRVSYASDPLPYQRQERAEYTTGGELWGFSLVNVGTPCEEGCAAPPPHCGGWGVAERARRLPFYVCRWRVMKGAGEFQSLAPSVCGLELIARAWPGRSGFTCPGFGASAARVCCCGAWRARCVWR